MFVSFLFAGEQSPAQGVFATRIYAINSVIIVAVVEIVISLP